MAASLVNGVDDNNMLKVHKNKVESNILDHFWKLSNSKSNIRNDAAFALLQKLGQKQQKATESGSTEPCKEVTYTLERLVRGLASSRDSARQGFFVCLVELLRITPDVSASHVLSTLNKSAKGGGGGGMSKSEKGDLQVGRTLAFGAIVKSERLNLTEQSPELETVVQGLIEAAGARIYLVPLALHFLGELCKTMDKSISSYVWGLLSPYLCVPWDKYSLDTLMLLLTLKDRFPSLIKKKFCISFLQTEEFISDSQQLVGVAKLLMTVPFISVALHHPVYPLITSHIAESGNVKVFFEEGLAPLIVKPTNARMQLALVLATAVVKAIKDHKQLKHVLSTLFVNLLMRALSTKEKEMQKMCKLFMDSLSASLKNEEVNWKDQRDVIKRLISQPGYLMLDRVTGTPFVHQLLRASSPQVIQWMVELLKGVLHGETPIVGNSLTPYKTRERVYAAQQIASLLVHPVMQTSMEWKYEQLKCLLLLGLCRPHNSDETVPSKEVVQACRDGFFRALDSRDWNCRLDAVGNILLRLCRDVEDNKGRLWQPLDPQSLDLWNRTLSVASDGLEGETDWKKLMFPTLALLLALHLFVDANVAADVLEDLLECDVQSGNSAEWVDESLQLLLSLLAWNRHLLRNVANSLFNQLLPHLTSEALTTLLEAVNPTSSNRSVVNLDEEEDGETDDDEESEISQSEEEPDLDADFISKIQSALGNSAALSDTESVDIDTMDDSEMNRIDTALSEAFRSMSKKSGANNKKQSKSDTALMHFRTRALDFIDLFASNPPSLSLALQAIKPLLHVLEFSVRTKYQKPLETRLKSCFKKLTSTRKYGNADDVVTQEELLQLIKEILQLADKMSALMSDVGDVMTECCTMVLRASLQVDGNHQNEMAALYIDAFNKFLEKKECVLPQSLFRHALLLDWNGCHELSIACCKGAFRFGEVRPFRLLQSLQFLQAVLQNHTLVIKSWSHVQVQVLGSQVTEEAKKIFDTCLNSSELTVKCKYLTELLKTLRILHGLQKRMESKGSIEFQPTLEDVAVVYGRVCSQIGLPPSNDLKKASNKFRAALQIQGSEKSTSPKDKLKRPVEDSEDSEEEILTQTKGLSKKKKKKLYNNIRKEKDVRDDKKNAKKLRNNAYSQGLEDISFAKLDIDSISHIEPSASDESDLSET